MPKIIEVINQPMATLQLIPDRSLRNYNVESLAKAMAEFYTRPLSRVSFKRQIKYRVPDCFAFRTILAKQGITYYLVVPERLVDHFKQKILAVWEKSTVKVANSLTLPDPLQCQCCELQYRRHDMFSLVTNRDENAPLPGILASTSEMQPKDLAVIDMLFEPGDRVQWEYDAGKAYEKFQAGKMPRKARVSVAAAVGAGMAGLNTAMTEIQNNMVNVMGGTKEGLIKPIDPEREMIAVKGLSSATTSKLHSATLQTFIRIASFSDDHERASLTLKALVGAYKDITADNELVRKDRKDAATIVKEITECRRPLFGGISCSTAEAGKLMQLPTAVLQDEYPIENIRQREVSLPDELFLEGPGISIGQVTEKGITRTAKIPVTEIPGVQLKHVYDALCTPTLGTGQMGCGKTEGMGGNWAHGFLLNGFSVFMIDTADGQQAKTLEDSLPADYPDDKIIHLELDNKHWPVALNWGDVASRSLAGAEDELEALTMAEMLTSRLIDYIDGNATAELSDRMRQYLTSASRAVLSDPRRSLLDVELALRSPAYREELLSDPSVKTQPEIIQDLLSLQVRAESGADASVVDPIVSRLKMFSESRALQNMYFQPNKLGKDGRPLLDFRKFADNPEGGYGYLVAIHASADAWGQDGQELVLSFIQDKILMAVYSRVDIPQDQRKPCLNLVDEPHRFINKAARMYKNASVELRKYRMKLLWLAHYLSQMGPAATAVAAGGCQFTQYRTQELQQFNELAHAFAPFEPGELYKSLPEKWEAVNKVRLPSGKDCPAFIAKMAPPPKMIRSRESRRQECAQEFGRHWKEVSGQIVDKRQRYRGMDEEWHAKKKREKEKK
ncbi:MAG: type IV secretory system conjugative DNA transfer family protein [Bacillota bacterium]